MATLTISVQQTQVTSSYVRARVIVYASGSITSGQTGTVTVRAWDASVIASAEISPAAQSSGTVEVYNALLNFKRRYSTSGGSMTKVEATLGSASAELYQQFELDGEVVAYGTVHEFGGQIPIAVCGDNDYSGFYIYVRIRGESSVASVTFKSGPTASGIYYYTIPESWMNLIPTKEYVTGISLVDSADTPCSFIISALEKSNVRTSCGPRVNVPDDIRPVISGLSYRDANGYGRPGDGVIDAFVQRLSSVDVWASVNVQGGAQLLKFEASYAGIVATLENPGSDIDAPTSSNPLSLGTITNTGTMPLVVTATDSRGRKGTASLQLLTAAYNFPTVSEATFERWDTQENVESDESTTVRLHIAGTISDVNGKGNNGTIKIYSAEAVQEPQFALKSTTNITPPNFEKFIDSTGYSETEAWRFRWVLEDRFGQTLQGETTIYGATPTIDVSPDGQSIGFWTTAGGREDVSGNPVNGFYLNGDMTLQEGKAIYGTGGADEGYMDIDKLLAASFDYSSQKFQLDAYQNIALQNDKYIAGYNAAGLLVRLLGVNADGYAELGWTQGGIRGRVCKTIWEGTWSTGGTITIPELPYYRLFLCSTNSTNIQIVAVRDKRWESQDDQASGLMGIGGYAVSANGIPNIFTMQSGGKSPTSLYLYKCSSFTGNSSSATSISINRIIGII